jgi:DNA topoisomerase-2
MSKKFGKRLNPFAHALTRPDTYIGSVATGMKEMWVYEEATKDTDNSDESGEEDASPLKGQLVFKKVKYNKGLVRIFVEIMSNAIDNKWRSEQNNVPMKSIKFTIDSDEESDTYGWITVYNDGYFIPVEKHEYEYEDLRTSKVTKDNLYPAEVLFGEMLAGTNFEDDQSRKTSGRNGMGAKACIVFSKEAVVEHTDPENQKKFYQTYRNNGKERDPPKVTSYKAKTGYTKISFLPDYEYFKYPEIDEDLYSIMKRYVYECSMITGLGVTLNDEKIIVKDLSKYARLYYPNAKDHCLMHFVAPNGDECVIVEKGLPEMDILESPAHVSWVNGINTIDGGTHVDAWQEAIFSIVVRTFNARKPKKGEKTALKTSAKELYPYFVMFVRSECFDAKFDSQTKDRLTQPEIIVLAGDKKEKAEFNTIVNEGVKKMMKWNFVGMLEEKLLAKADRAQTKKDGVKKKVALGKNGTDANFAGGKLAGECTLFITEGLSAKLFADSLIANIEDGTDYYGSFAIRGKFINVQKASNREISANEEVKALKQVLGLVQGTVYKDTSELRYGKVIIMTDQDDDGFHIRGLLLNFFWHLWPSLMELGKVEASDQYFLGSFTTMVVKAEWGKNMKMFYSNPEFRQWYDEEGHKIKGLKIKYYKGLGTHKPGEEQHYLDDQKILRYTTDGEDDKYMALGFDKPTAVRKDWITKDMVKPGEMKIEEYDQPITIDGPISLAQFVREQLIIYHRMALRRAIPNIYDGAKEGQRKALYGIMTDPDAKRGAVNLENLVGSIKNTTGYHHGAVSLEDTVKKMAQGFVGSNNIPLLVNEGQFGSREVGGKNAAAARYIATKLEDITKTIFHPDDEPILERSVEDGKEVEYKYYMPILPIILVNGAIGIASGFSCEIPSYNPDDIVRKIEGWLDGDSLTDQISDPLMPWYRGYTGTIELLKSTGKGKYEPWEESDEKPPVAWKSTGILEQGKGGWWHIRELPIGMWTEKMKGHLEYLSTGTPPEGSKKKKKGDRHLLTVNWKGTPNTIHWDIKPTKDFIPDIDVAGNFKCLQATNRLTNIYVIDENDYPRKYSRPEELLQDFCTTRLEYYDKRRDYWLDYWGAELAKETSRHKFVKAVVDKKLNMYQEDDALEGAMIKLGLKKIEDSKGNETFDYLLSMQMRSMTVKRLEEIKKEVEKIKVRLSTLEAKTSKDLWREDLDKFKEAWVKFQKTRNEEKIFKTKKRIKL